MSDEKEYTVDDFKSYDPETKLLTDNVGNTWWPIEWRDKNGETIGINKANQAYYADALYMRWDGDSGCGCILWFANRSDLVDLIP